MGRLSLMPLPPSIADPLFLHELALELKMPVSELGQRMSNYELCVMWPAFFAERARHEQAEAQKRASR